MLLEAESGRLYVGARGAAFALDASNVSASTGLTVSLFCSHVVEEWGGGVVRRLGSQNLQLSNGLICIAQGRNFGRQQCFIFSHECVCVCVCSQESTLHSNHRKLFLHKRTYNETKSLYANTKCVLLKLNSE